MIAGFIDSRATSISSRSLADRAFELSLLALVSLSDCREKYSAGDCQLTVVQGEMEAGRHSYS